MNQNELNSILRELFADLSEKYRKSQICLLTLGSHNLPQLENFLSGKEFGIKPLQRIIEGFGYKLQLVCVEKENDELINYLADVNKIFIEDCREKIEANIDKSPIVRKNGEVARAIVNLIDDIIN